MAALVFTTAPAATAAAAAPAASFSDAGLAGPFPAPAAQAGALVPYVVPPTVTQVAVAPPAAVTAVPVGDGGAAVSWSPPTVAAPDAYWVQTYTAQGQYLGEQVAAPSASSAAVTGLVPSQDYLFAVLTEAAGSFSAYTFSPQLRTAGFTGTAGTPVPLPVNPVGIADVPSPQSLVDTVSAAVKEQLRATLGAATNATVQGDPVLGREAWQTYFPIDAGSGQDLRVNVANGNVVLSATDSTPVQAHGQLSYTARRTYNSQDTRTLVTTPGSVGAGWRLNLGEEAGDTTNLGVLGSALQVPDPTNLSAGAVTLVDRDGTRHVFQPKPPPGGVQVAEERAQLRYLTETVCVDQAYSAPPGVHLGLFRYIVVGGSSCSSDVLHLGSVVVLGYKAIRPDRVTTYYASNGALLSLVDRHGNELRYVYDYQESPDAVQAQQFDYQPSPGALLGRLRYVYEPRSCSYTPASFTDPGPLPGNCRGFRLSYPAGNAVTITDPASRSTTYTLTASNPQALLGVRNPDASTLAYTYQGVGSPMIGSCGGLYGQLCSITDSRGGTTSLSYTSNGLISQITDRRGTVYHFFVQPPAAATATTTATPGTASVYWGPADLAADTHLTNYTGIDPAGRVGQVEEIGNAARVYRRTQYGWDTAAAPCAQPAPAGVDNNLCSVTQASLGGATGPPSQTTSWTYNPQGLPLTATRQTAGGPPVVTSWGYASIYVTTADDTGQPLYRDSISGNGTVTSDANRDDPLYVVTDQTSMLPPRGNQQGSDPAAFAPYETFYQYSPGGYQPLPGNELVVAVDAPSPAGGRSRTTYGYDGFGQRTSMTTPKANAETPAGQTPPSYTYAYYADSDADLSGTTQAGGWLRSVTDPAGHSVAFGYDAAGNVARTWDRNATNGRPITDFPGTLTGPPNGQYAETLHADPGPGRDPSPAARQAAYSQPWRWTWSSLDPLGNRSRTTYDRNGNPVRMTPPRGTQLSDGTSSPTSYDTTMTYDPGDLPVSRLTPAEAQANGSSADHPTSLTYDVYGNLTSATDPRGVVTGTDYDAVDRPVAAWWTRGAYGPDAPSTCRAATPADGPRFTTGTTLCSSGTAYDGLDQVIASTDGTNATTTYAYDAFGRRTGVTMPRNNNGIASVRTQTTYDADGHVLDACAPREFTEGSNACTAGSTYARHTAYNPAGFPVSVTTHRDATTALTTRAGYDADGNPTASTDANGHVTSTAYDLLDRPTALTKPRSGTISYTTTMGYDPVGNRTSVSTPVDATTNRLAAYSYDADNRLLDSVTGASSPDARAAGTPSSDGGSNIRTRVVYDADGHPVGTYHPRAFSTSTTNPDPRYLTRVDLDADGRPTAAYSPRYDTSDTGLNDPTGAGGTQSADCPTGITPAPVTVPPTMPALPAYPGSTGICVTRTQYDPAGQPLISTLPTAGGKAPGQTSRQVTSTWTDDRLLAAQAGPSPTGTGTATTTSRYDAVGRPLAVTDPLGHVTTSTYTSDHLEASTTDQGYTRSDGTVVSHSSSISYSADGDAVTTTDPLGQQASSSYTADGLVAARTNTGGGTTRYTYDLAGNSLSELSPSGAAKDTTNPDGIATQHTYTDDNLLLTTLQPPSTDGHRRQVTWSYDFGGRKTAQLYQELDSTGAVLAGGGTQSFTYYPDSRLQRETGRGNSPLTPETITNSYDAAGNITTAADSTNNGSTLTSTYYLDDAPRTVDDGRGGTTRYALSGSAAVAVRQRTSPNAPTQTSVTSFNDAGLHVRMTSDAVPVSSASPWTWAYDAAGRTTVSTTPETQTTTSTYNPDDTLADQTSRRGDPTTGTLVAQWRYTYDNLNRQLTADGTQLQPDNTTTPLRQSFAYNATGRLTANTDSQGAHTSSYDADGNRLTYSTPAGPGTTAATQVTAYNPDDSVKTSNSGQPGATTLVSDYRAAGVLNDDGCTTYSYDGFDRLASTTPKSGTPCATAPARATTKWAYDAFDRQRSSDQTTTSTTVTTYSDGTKTSTVNPPVRTITGIGYDGASSTTSTETTPGAPSRRYTLDPPGSPAAVTFQPGSSTTPTSQYLGTDGQGSITTITGAMTATGTTTGTSGIACASRLDAWGKPLTTSPVTSSPNGTPTAGAYVTDTATSGTNVGASPDPCPVSKKDGTTANAADTYYNGERRDAGTGDYQLGTRTYDPAKAAFLSQDTYRSAAPEADLGLGTDPLTQNRYTYVNGDPVNLVDPDGHGCAARDDDELCPNQHSGGQSRARDSEGRYVGASLTYTERVNNTRATHREVARTRATIAQRAAVRRLAAANPDPPKVTRAQKKDDCSGFCAVGRSLETVGKGAANVVTSGGSGIVRGVTKTVTLGLYEPNLNICAFDEPGALRTTCDVTNRALNDATQVAAAVAPGGGLLKAAALAARGAKVAEAGGELATVGNFASKQSAFAHYAKHVAGVDLRSPGNPVFVGADMAELGSFGEYQSAARAFIGGGARDGVLEGVRPGGDLLRLDPKSGYFGVRSPTGTVRTFFRPNGGPDEWLQYFHSQFAR